MKTALFIIFLFGLVQLPFDFPPFAKQKSEYSRVRVLPPGITYLSRPIILSSGESLIGNNSTLVVMPGANCPAIIVGDTNPDPQFTTVDVHISSITIDGRMEDQQWEGWGGHPDKLEHSIRNNGITIRRAEGVVVQNVSVSRCRSGGIVVERGSKDIVIANSTFSDNFFDGCAFYESSHIYLTGVNMINNHYAGFSSDLDFKESAIVNSTISGNGREGVFMRFSKRNLFDRVVFCDNGGFPIFLAKSELPDSAATENVFSNCFFFAQGGEMQINDPDFCLSNLLVHPRYEVENLIGLLK